MRDLVEKLRKWAAFGYGYEATHDMRQAAAEIERLRAALDVVRASGLLIGSTTLHDRVRAVVHAALAEEKPNDP